MFGQLATQRSDNQASESKQSAGAGQSAESSGQSARQSSTGEGGFWQRSRDGRLGQSAAAKKETPEPEKTEPAPKEKEDTFKKSSPFKKVFGSQQAGQQASAKQPERQQSYKQVSNNMNFEQRRLDLTGLPFWELDGRIGVTVDQDAYNGSLNWKQEQDDLDFRFRGPLGIGGVRIHGTLGEQVRVKTTRGDEFYVQDMERDLEEKLGWQLPINSLRYWVLGVTDPNFDTAVEIDENDLLVELEQEDWVVSYDQYMDVNGRLLPKKLKVLGPRTKVRLVVNDWTLSQ